VERSKYSDEAVYKMLDFQLSAKKLATLDALDGKVGESHLSPAAREAIVLELTIRVLTFIKLEADQARWDEAERAIESVTTASSLAEAKAKAIWRLRKMG
jgi:hypothetical protein